MASCLDAFSSYPQQLSCPAVPFRTTGTPEAARRCSSRTEQRFLAVFFRFHQVEADLSHDGLNPAHVPLSWASSPTLGPCCRTRMGRDDIAILSEISPRIRLCLHPPALSRPPCEDLEQRRGWRMMTRSLSRPPDCCRDTSDVPRRETAPSHLIAPHIMRAQSLRGHMGRSFYL